MNADERKLGPPFYKYESSSTKGKCTEYMGDEIDYHYTLIDEYFKYNVYNENRIIPKIQDFIEYSEEPYPLDELNNYTLSLYKRSYVGFNLTCLGEEKLNEQSTKYVKKDEETIFELNIWAMIFIFMQIIYYSVSLRDPSYANLLLILIGAILIIPLISASLNKTLVSTNPIFRCVESNIAEQFINTENLDFTLIIVSFCLYMFMVLSNLLLLCIRLHNQYDEEDSIQTDTKENELAELGFIKEEPLTEQQTL